MEKKKIKIEHKELYDNFYRHILIEENSRVLFTAPYGFGKSTFLKDFFNNYNKEFIPIYLNPVSYSTAENKDVFELIKYDLLLALITNYSEFIDLTTDNFTFLLASQTFAIQKFNSLNLSTFISGIISSYELIGKTPSPILSQLLEHIEEIKQFQEDAKSDEGEIIKKYLLGSENSKGSHIEKDSISILISDLLERLVERKKNEKIERKNNLETILVIDDLDRLDPEHIFRLFNVFSSHYNYINNENKFGFSKIIFVCDIMNIRNIFISKYGPEADFSGYMDKFYSCEIFHFDNTFLIKKSLSAIINATPYLESGLTENYSIHNRTRLYSVFEWIIFSFLETKLLNLRTIMATTYIPFQSYSFHFGDDTRQLNSEECGILLIFEVLKQFFGTINLVQLNLKRLMLKELLYPTYESDGYKRISTEKHLVNFLLPFILPEKLGFPDSEQLPNETRNHKLVDEDVVFHFTYIANSSGYRRSIPNFVKLTQRSDTGPETNIEPYKWLYKVYDKCIKQKIVK